MRWFGTRSLGNLKGVHPDLVKVVTLALEKGPEDFTVIEGVRSLERQRELYAQGRTAAALRAAGLGMVKPRPGPVVTWTLKSKHIDGLAVDLVTIRGGVIDWASCDKIAIAMFAASRELNIPIRWGADWDRDGKPRERGETDSPHFELAR